MIDLLVKLKGDYVNVKFIYICIFRMNGKLDKLPTIWRFLSGLRDYIIEPAKTDVYQLRNGKAIRKPSKVSNVQARRQIAVQEEKLRNGSITPMQFVQYMSHHVKVAEPDENDDELERLAEEAEAKQFEPEDEGDDEVFNVDNG